MWELKYVAISLAYPGLKPTPAVVPAPTRPHEHVPEAEQRRMLALDFPPINEVIRWQDLFPTFNKVALIAVPRRR